MRRSTLALLTAAVVAVGAAGVVLGPRLLGGDDTGDVDAARALAASWSGGTLAGLPWDPASGTDPAGQVARLTSGLEPGTDDRPADVRVAGTHRDGDRATADLDVRWDVGVPWSYRSVLPLHRTGGAWRPVLSPTVVHPSLTAGRVLRSRLVPPPRAAITDRTGAPIVTDRPVVTVGLQPSRTPDLDASATRLAALTGVDAAGLVTRARAAKPDTFVEVVTLRRDAYDPQRAPLQAVPGAVFREGLRQLGPTTAFARALLGTVGPATADAVSAGAGKVRPDQAVGLSGLQQKFDSRLGGTAGVVVESVDGTGGAPQQLQSTPPVAGTPLQLTLDSTVQQAADAALSRAPAGRTSALVAVQPSTGDVLAVANAGPAGPGQDRALSGRYPPGSTFKIASTLALLRQGLTSDAVVACPPTVTVQGKTFANAESEQLGPVPFRTDFAKSCNTAFVGSAGRVSGQQLQAAALDLGYGADDPAVTATLGVPVFGGDVPAASDPVEHAADMIGQGRVLASPLSVAVSATTVASGALHPRGCSPTRHRSRPAPRCRRPPGCSSSPGSSSPTARARR